jgi:hypothetical protein
MKAVRNIQREGRPSAFKSKLKDAIDHGKEWEGRDITYYQYTKEVEKENIVKQNKIQYSRQLDVEFNN